jgi:hypothetical protein
MKNCILWGTTIVQPIKAVGANLVIEDDNGVAIEISVYNLFHDNAKLKDLDKVFPLGCRIAVKNPYLRYCRDGNLMLRTDNP